MQCAFQGPAWELACDEALVEAGEAGEIVTGVLRFWEATTPFVVLGYANKTALEVHLPSSVPVLRRCSGGGSVLQGPGCLNYSLVLPINAASELASITQTNCYIMQRHGDAIASLIDQEVLVDGYTDLTLDGRKFSGNSQRRKSRWLLFHGTFLFHCDLQLMARVLRPPPREPAYRNGRGHAQFLTTLSARPTQVMEQLCRAWNAQTPFKDLPSARIEQLIETKYSREDWNFRT
jgi:lipoate-protein ligase A